MTILVTGAAGFIGSNFVLDWLSQSEEDVVSLDLLTYAGNIKNLSSVIRNSHHHFVQGSISDHNLIIRLLKEYQIRAVIHFAAETHVDRSIHAPKNFIQTNIVGTYDLLESVKMYWNALNRDLKKNFRFLHVSTDEVYGSLQEKAILFSESHPYHPNNPYSASKAASDHLVRAWFQTYQLPVLTTNCSNNYGPYQLPDKLIPMCILKALQDVSIPIYGNGKQIRDWIFVIDHCNAIREVLNKGRIGETYNIGSWNEQTNLEVAEIICTTLDELKPRSDNRSYCDQIILVKDRPGHDMRYAIDASKIERELEWKAKEKFETGLRKTVIWYLENQSWIDGIVPNAK